MVCSDSCYKRVAWNSMTLDNCLKCTMNCLYLCCILFREIYYDGDLCFDLLWYMLSVGVKHWIFYELNSWWFPYIDDLGFLNICWKLLFPTSLMLWASQYLHKVSAYRIMWLSLILITSQYLPVFWVHHAFCSRLFGVQKLWISNIWGHFYSDSGFVLLNDC